MTHVRSFFATQIYTASLKQPKWRSFNTQLQRECLQVQHDDQAGRRWSQRNYPGGFTSYSSANRMQQRSPTFAQLERNLSRHVLKFAQQLGFDAKNYPLAMTDCWVNIMPPGVAHGLHLHPLATLSGTYYVSTPASVPGLKFEDPRLDRFMAAPPRTGKSTPQPWVILPVSAGQLIIFESWLRHEVTANTTKSTRISISFNFHWA